MRVINAFRFLISFLIMGIFTFLICLLFGTNKALVYVYKNISTITNKNK